MSGSIFQRYPRPWERDPMFPSIINDCEGRALFTLQQFDEPELVDVVLMAVNGYSSEPLADGGGE